MLLLNKTSEILAMQSFLLLTITYLMKVRDELLRLYTNFFLPSAKLLSKDRDGAKIRKRYDAPQTPYNRLLSSPHIEHDVKENLKKAWMDLNPAELKRGMLKLSEQLMKLRTAC